MTTDVAPEMLEAARRRAEELGLDVELRVEDAAALSFPDASVDGVLCRWGLMLVPDLSAATSEIARVLRPGGRAAVAVWADPEQNEWMTAAGRSALELGLLERPHPDAPGPFRLSAPGRLAGALEGAGLDAAAVEDVSIAWRSRSFDEWWRVAVDTSRMVSKLLERLSREEAMAVREGAERRLSRYVREDGVLEVPGLARVALAVRRG